MGEPIKPIEETEEYAAAVEDEAPLSALTPKPAERAGMITAAVTAAGAYTEAVRATEMFVVDLTGPPTQEAVTRYTMLQERENITWQRRREAFAAIGLHHEPAADDGTW